MEQGSLKDFLRERERVWGNKVLASSRCRKRRNSLRGSKNCIEFDMPRNDAQQPARKANGNYTPNIHFLLTWPLAETLPKCQKLTCLNHPPRPIIPRLQSPWSKMVFCARVAASAGSGPVRLGIYGSGCGFWGMMWGWRSPCKSRQERILHMLMLATTSQNRSA